MVLALHGPVLAHWGGRGRQVDALTLPLRLLLFALVAVPHLLHVDGQFVVVGPLLPAPFGLLALPFCVQEGPLLAGARGVLPPVLLGGLLAARFVHLVAKRARRPHR